jgi:hypothetical protein
MTGENVRSILRVASRWGGGTVLALVAPLLLYIAAGLIGGAVPVNAGWRPPAQGVRIFVESNGVHTGIVVPKVAAGIPTCRSAGASAPSISRPRPGPT